MSQVQKIIFFDGVCSLCNGFVDFLIKRDSRQLLRYAPLQGSAARALLKLQNDPEFDSIVYFKDGQSFTHSDAVIEILGELGGLWRLASLAKFIPKVLRNSAYSLIASNRYKWFGRRETCRLPSPVERKLFLE